MELLSATLTTLMLLKTERFTWQIPPPSIPLANYSKMFLKADHTGRSMCMTPRQRLRRCCLKICTFPTAFKSVPTSKPSILLKPISADWVGIIWRETKQEDTRLFLMDCLETRTTLSSTVKDTCGYHFLSSELNSQRSCWVLYLLGNFYHGFPKVSWNCLLTQSNWAES